MRDRRFEARYPVEAAALALLDWTKGRAPVNAALEKQIRDLASR